MLGPADSRSSSSSSSAEASYATGVGASNPGTGERSEKPKRDAAPGTQIVITTGGKATQDGLKETVFSSLR